MKLTIIPADKAVYKDDYCYSDLTWSGTPLNVHALQWMNTNGWIEFSDGTPNENITQLPVWANNALAAWQAAYDDAHRPPTLEEVKTNKNIQIEGWRDAARYSNIAVGGYTWQADQNSQNLLSSAVTLTLSGVIPCPSVWRDYNNQDVQVTIQDLQNIVSATAVRTEWCYQHSWDLKAQVEAATTIPEVEAITW